MDPYISILATSVLSRTHAFYAIDIVLYLQCRPTASAVNPTYFPKITFTSALIFMVNRFLPYLGAGINMIEKLALKY